ncbi:MAG TPA: SRPBCC family protein [Mycobacteriales bacterium]|nr:SRPBCC family protein [Mycobacteriales bacterium]
MWVREFTGTSTVSPERVFAVLADAERWSEWNAGVARIELAGPFAAGTAAVMHFPDGSALPFHLTWVEPGAGYEDLTPMPGGAAVRVRHLLAPNGPGTRITYRCEVEGSDAATIGEGVTADFPDVIAALAARAAGE